MNILIPHGGVAVWDELKYCLRSIEKYCPVANISIYGDKDIDWLNNVAFEKLDRYRSGILFENYWDTLNKIHHYCKYHHNRNFLYVYDDQIFLKPFDPEIFHNVALQDIHKDDNRKDRHGRTINKAVQLLGKNHVWNYETHIPRWFDCNMMFELYKKFDILNQDTPPALSTLYYNYYYDTPKQVLTERNGIRASFCFEEDDAGCYLATNKGEIIDAVRDKYVLHYNDKGLNFSPGGHQILKEYIEELFPDKCKYEK